MKNLEKVNKSLILFALAVYSVALAETGADALFEAEKWQEAVQAYESRVQEHPGDVSAWVRLAVSARNAERIEITFAALREAADLGFNALAFIDNDPILSAMAGDEGFDGLVDDLQRRAFPCEYDPAFSEFDFWVGEWDVHVASGQLAGSNVIAREQRGCYLSEKWTSAGGGSGDSINYVDKITGEWVQVWNDASGTQINIRGGMTDEGMLLVGTIHNVATNTSKSFRGLWTALPDGRVRQYFEQSDDGGSSWTSWFEGFYTRKSD